MEDGLSHWAAVQVVISSWSALSQSIELGSFRTAYLPYFLYEKKIAELQVLISREDCFPPLSQRESFNGVEDPVNREEKFDKAT